MSAPLFRSVNHPSPAEYAVAVTLDVTFSTQARGVYVGGAGDVSVRFANGTDIVFVGVPAGSILPVRAVSINTSGTSATSLVALF